MTSWAAAASPPCAMIHRRRLLRRCCWIRPSLLRMRLPRRSAVHVLGPQPSGAEQDGENSLITLYHCMDARSLRPLWMMEELGLPYELKMLPFPPRVLAKEYLNENPLGTIPLLLDGETRMTESSAMCEYLATRYGPTQLAVTPDDADFGSY